MMLKLILPILIAFICSLAIGPVGIPLLQKLKFGQVIKPDGPQWHAKKTGTPTMGGLIMILTLAITMLVLLRVWNSSLVVGLGLIGAAALIGFLDDYIGIALKRNEGLSARTKLILQIVISMAAGLYAYQHIGTSIKLPFTTIQWDMGIWYYPFIVFVMVAMMNSANLTDGLDGLAAGVGLIIFSSFALMFFFLGNPLDDEFLLLSAAMAGVCLGFLRFNVFPARLFMGDTGSLPLGVAIAWIGIVAKIPLWLPIMAGMYMISTISDIIQIVSYKTRKKRVFKMAPIHHHFEMLGYPETKISSMYMMITVVLCLLGLLAIR